MEKTTPKVSVVIPVYNCEKYIAEAIDSVLAQTYDDLECIVVNDGSTDGTAHVLDRYESDPRVVRIDQENKRMAGARNTALKVARGKYVAFLDSDDLWRKDKLMKQVAVLEGNPDIGLVYSNCSYYYGDGEIYGDSFSFQNPHRGRVTEKLLFGNFISILTVMLRRSLYEKAVYDEGEFFRPRFNLSADLDHHMRVSVHCDFDYIDEPLAMYRVHPENASRNYSAMMLECSDLHADFRRRHPEVVAKNPAVYRESRLYWIKRLGYSYLIEGEMKKARRCYMEYCREEPAYIKGWATALLTHLGKEPFKLMGIYGKNTFMSKEAFDAVQKRTKK